MDTNCNTDCEPIGEIPVGVSLVAARLTGGDDCPQTLENATLYPSLPVVPSSGSVELYDGSSVDEINLAPDATDKIIKPLISIGAHGTIKAFKAPQVPGVYKVIADGSSIRLVPDKFVSLLPNTLDTQLASVHVLGANKVTPACPTSDGQFPYQLFKVATNFAIPALNAVNDTATADVETPEIIDVTANDTFTGDLVITITVEPTHGTVDIEIDGTITYTPDPLYCGSDSFTYQIADEYGQTDTATVAVTVTCPAIAAVADAVNTDFETPLNFDPKGNDTGVGISVTAVVQPTNGTVVIELDNTLTYTPDIGYDGADPFLYTITDDYGQVRSAVITVTVAAEVLSEPTCYAGSVEYHYDASLLSGLDASAVPTWADTSGNSRDATQATGGFQPILKLAIRNGLNVVEFDGSDDVLATSAFSVTALANSTLFAVFKPDTAGGAVFARKANSAGAAGEEIDIFTSATEINAKVGITRATVAYADGTNWMLVKMTTDFSTASRVYEMTVNGVLLDSSGSYDVGAPGSQIMRLGCRNHGFGNEVFFDGQIGEIILISDYDATCETNWETYLKSKWGFTY